MDEDTHFLNMLDAATERVFEAYSKSMAAESNAIDVACFNHLTRKNSSLRRDKELSSQSSSRHTISPPPLHGSSLDEPRRERKRRRTTDQPTITGAKINLSVNEKTQSVAWPEEISFESYGVNNSIKKLSEESSSLVKDSDQLQNKTAFGIERNVDHASSVAIIGNSLLPGATLPPLAENYVGSERKNTEIDDDFSKKIHAAIIRIESLVPSLQKLVVCADTSNEKSVSSFGLGNISSSSRPDGVPLNSLGMAIDRETTRNKPPDIDKSSVRGETVIFKQVDPMVIGNAIPVALPSNQNTTLRQANNPRGDVEVKREECKGPNENMCQIRIDIPPNWLTMRNDGGVKGENNLDTDMSQVPRSKVKAPINRVDSLIYRGSQNKATSRGSIGSSSTTRPNRTTKMGRYKHRQSQSRTMERMPSQMMQFRDSINRNSVIRRRKTDRTSQSSEERSWSSPASYSGTSALQSGYPSSSGSYQSSYTYDSRPDESEAEFESAHQSPRRKRSEYSEISPGYDTSSYYSSQDQYSDAYPSSGRNSFRRHKWEHRLEKRKGGGTFSGLRKRMGMIFHHHHHHQHYNDRHEPGVGHANVLKWLGKMFYRNRKNNNKKPESEKLEPPVSKSVVKKKQGGQFHALMNGLVRHVRRSKKSKEAKDGIRRLGSPRHGGKRANKNLPWWPKMLGRRGRVKVFNKRKGKFKMAAAKMILKRR